MREIGSEFNYDQNRKHHSSGIPRLNNELLVFSGRTAIETVLKNEPGIHSALLPSYCCDSMIEPFLKIGIKVNFYPVHYDKGLRIKIDINIKEDCLLWCNYFGFNIPMPDMTEFISRGGIIIEDITHSLYSKHMFHEQSHYLVASLRKWEPILCGGYCSSNKHTIENKPKEIPSDSFLSKKKEAMIMKSRYLSGKYKIEKSKFLQLFSDSNKWFAENYSGLTIDEYSKNYLMNFDYEGHRKQRINNAKIIYKHLKKNEYIDFMFSIDKMDCPLFIPVIVHNNKRDELRQEFADNDIYLPVHWPHPKVGCISNLYDLELSLVCDQRYNEKDMIRIIEILNNH